MWTPVEWTGRANGTNFRNRTIEVKLARFLFNYRVTPHSSTAGISTVELMSGQQLRTRFGILQPDIANKAHKKQEKQKEGFDWHTKDWKFSQGDYVYARNFHDNSTKWLLGKILKQIGNVAFVLRLYRRYKCLHEETPESINLHPVFPITDHELFN